MAPRAGQAGKAFRDVLAFLRLPRGSGSEPTLGRENLVAVFTTSRKQVEVHVQGDHERTKRRKKGRKDKEEEEEKTKIECIRMNSKEYHSFAPPLLTPFNHSFPGHGELRERQDLPTVTVTGSTQLKFRKVHRYALKPSSGNV